MSTLSPHAALVAYLLRLGDNNVVLSQRLCAWVSKAPMLEEELAVANVALDLLGQGRWWWGLAGSLMEPARTEDELAFWREPHEFQSLLLVEQPNGHYADTLVRQFLFDAWHHLVLADLMGASDDRIAALATKAQREVSYHLRRSSQWLIRLGRGTAQSQQRTQQALSRLWPYVDELFSPDAVDEAMAQAGVCTPVQQLRRPWMAYVQEVLSLAVLSLPPACAPVVGGKQGQHGEHLAFMLMEMQHLQHSHPGATW